MEKLKYRQKPHRQLADGKITNRPDLPELFDVPDGARMPRKESDLFFTSIKQHVALYQHPILTTALRVQLCVYRR